MFLRSVPRQNPLGLSIYTLKKKMKDRRVKQVFSRGEYQWEGVRHKERVIEGEHGGCSLYLYMKIED
jgi:hypothetical protein